MIGAGAVHQLGDIKAVRQAAGRQYSAKPEGSLMTLFVYHPAPPSLTMSSKHTKQCRPNVVFIS